MQIRTVPGYAHPEHVYSDALINLTCLQEANMPL